MKDRIWYYKYHDIALCREKGAPIHAHELGNLPAPERILKDFPGLKLDEIRVASMSKQEFFSKEWPK